VNRIVAGALAAAIWIGAGSSAEAARPRKFDMICDTETNASFGATRLPTQRSTVRYAFDLDEMDFCIVAQCRMGLEEVLEGDDNRVVARHFARIDFTIDRNDGTFSAHSEADMLGTYSVTDRRGTCREAPFTPFPPEAY